MNIIHSLKAEILCYQLFLNYFLNFKAMKNLSLIFLVFCSLTVNAQSAQLSMQEQFMHATVRIETTTVDENGNLTSSGGTGFFFNFKGLNNSVVPVIISNCHVVENAIRGSMYFTTEGSNNMPIYGDVITLELGQFSNRWYQHPDPEIDLCLLFLKPVLDYAFANTRKNIFYRALGEEHFPSIQDWEAMLPTDKVAMVGYPNGFCDKNNNMPNFRQGIISGLPKLGFEGRNEFLIDIPVYGGSSGSPIIIFKSMGNGIEKIMFGGVVYAGPIRDMVTTGNAYLNGEQTDLQIITQAQVPINLGYVIMANELLAFQPIIYRLQRE